MSIQNDGQTRGSRESSEDFAALAKFLIDNKSEVARDQQPECRSGPVPRLDWPADLFRDTLAN